MSARDQFIVPDGIYLLTHSVGCQPRTTAARINELYLEPWATPALHGRRILTAIDNPGEFLGFDLPGAAVALLADLAGDFDDVLLGTLDGFQRIELSESDLGKRSDQTESCNGRECGSYGGRNSHEVVFSSRAPGPPRTDIVAGA